MSIRKRALLFLLALGLLTLALQPLYAQSNSNAAIAWPPPTYVVNGAFTVYGTANVPNMNGYFLEFRPLVDSVTPAAANVSWQPATLPGNTPVVNGVLGVWNTTAVPDGLYELRLSVLTTSGQFIYSRVSPLRVQNQPSPYANLPPAAPTSLFPIAVPTSVNSSGQAEALAVIDANVRMGDSTLFPEVGALLLGQRAPVIGVSTTGSGWWLIQLPSGQSGWIAPSTVQISGNIGSVPPVSPPPPPTPIPTPIPTATAILLPDATILNVRFDHDPKVNEQFNIIVTVGNQSPEPLPQVSVACNITPQNVFVSTYLDGLGGFGQADVSIPVTLTSGGGSDFTAQCAVDVNNLVPELAEYNNYYNRTKTLSN